MNIEGKGAWYERAPIEFLFPGDPVGDQRARIDRHKTKTGKTFITKRTPDKPARWKADAMALIEKKFDGAPTRGPLDLHVLAVMKRPGRLRRKKDPDTRIWAASFDKGSKPDEDNLLKLVQDTLTQAGVLLDDSFVCSGGCVKVYQGIRDYEEQPHVHVWITSLLEPPPPMGAFPSPLGSQGGW